MLRPYRQMLAVAHLPALIIWSLLARLHFTGTSIAVTFLVHGWTGSYALAGVVAMSLTIGNGIAGPLRGRVADRGSASRLMLVSGGVYSLGLVVLVLLPSSPSIWPVAAVIAFGTGLFLPPAGQIGRSVCQRIAEGDARDAAFSVEATLMELTFMIGPMITALTAAYGGGRAAVGLCAAMAGLGSLGFAIVLRRAGVDQPVPRTAEQISAKQRSVLTQRGVRPLLAMCLFMVAAFVSVDLVLVAWAKQINSPALAGVLIAVWAGGSLIGGLISGGLTGPPRLVRRMAAVALGIAVLVPVLPPVLDPSSPWLVGPLLALGGLAIAPAFAANNSRLAELAPQHRLAEAFGWMSTASTIGSASAAPVAGWLLDHLGPAAAMGAAAASAVVAVLMGLRSQAVSINTPTPADLEVRPAA